MAETSAFTMNPTDIWNARNNTLQKLVSTVKLNKLKYTDIRKQCDIQIIGEWVLGRIKECDEHISWMLPCLVEEEMPNDRWALGRSHRSRSDP